MVKHIKVKRSFYYHHGIYIGKNKVIHFNGELFRGKSGAKITITSLNEFLRGGSLEVVPYKIGIDEVEVLKRANSLLNRGDYSILFNNCEHFANYCFTGVGISKQINKYFLNLLKFANTIFP